MVKLVFGLPGTGKTTLCAAEALKAASPRSRYKHVYGNIKLVGIPKYVQIKPDDIGKYMLEDCLIIIDESTVYFDNRDYKAFSKAVREFLMLHRHYSADLIFCCQIYNGVDKSIRSLCTDLIMLKKPLLTGWYKTKMYKIPYDIIIPDKKDTGSAHLGEIVEGYCKPSFLVQLFSPSIKRPRYYKYFDSWSRPELPDLPTERILEQDKTNRDAMANIDAMLSKLPKWRFLKRAQLTKFKKQVSKTLTR